MICRFTYAFTQFFILSIKRIADAKGKYTWHDEEQFNEYDAILSSELELTLSVSWCDYSETTIPRIHQSNKLVNFMGVTRQYFDK